MKFRKILSLLLKRLPEGKIFDLIYAYVFFWVAHHRVPKLKSLLFNDYLFFLKTSHLIDLPIRHFVSDKDQVKIFYRGVLGVDLAPLTLKKFNSFQEFMASTLPPRCILKPAHLSGCIFLNEGKESLTKSQLDLVETWFKKSMYYHVGRERNYKNLLPSVIAEELIDDFDSVRDYKIFCFSGKARAIQVDVDRHSSHKRRMYTANWEALPYAYNKPLAQIELKPAGLDEALVLAEKIAKHFDFIRVDTYLINGRVYLGELTCVPENAHGRFDSVDSESDFMRLLMG